MVDATFEALWKSVLDGWDDERVHGAFLEYCQATDRLAEAAAIARQLPKNAWPESRSWRLPSCTPPAPWSLQRAAVFPA